ncbi:MAG: WXG100 family type VII secretion target [Clostridiales bacterium]|nr:WXG100 family type VII secretion target [Clostridiales bacterium]
MALEGTLKVTPEELKTQSGKVRTRIQNLESSFETMRTLISGTAAYWTGSAAEAHREDYESKKGTIEEMINRYTEHVRDLETMAGVYQEAEAQAVNLADELPASSL